MGAAAPAGPPIEQLAADLRRLLRLHGELLDSAHLAMRAHRLWAIEAAIGVRPALPDRIAGLVDKEERYATLPATFAAITGYVAERARPRA